MADTILEVKNLVKTFRTHKISFTAVDNISFSMSNGEILGVLGPNGAGKTTTIQMLMGVMEPTSGNISYFGKPFSVHRTEILSQLNFASTYISLPWNFTVAEILDVFALLYEIPNKKERIQKLLQTFDLEHLQKRTYHQLSAGERTRLVITKAFLNYPKLILLDEPTASLDPEIAQKVRGFLLKEKQEYNVSILLTSHNMSEVEEICDRILVINHGKIIDEGTPEKLMKQIATCHLELVITKGVEKLINVLTEEKVLFTQQKSRFTIIVEEQKIASFLNNITKENIVYEEISIRKPDLEDYFLEIIERSKKND